MLTTTVDLAAIVSADKWKADYFAHARQRAAVCHYDLVSLKEVVEERREFLDPQEFSDHRFHYLGLEHIASNTGALVDYRPRNGSQVKSRSKVFREDDVLYGRLRPYLNKVFLARDPVSSGICSGEFYVLAVDRARCVPAFLRELLASRFVRDATHGLHSGSALPRLQLSDLLDVAVPIPPVEVQLALCEKLADVYADLCDMRAAIEQRPAKIESELYACMTEGKPLSVGAIRTVDHEAIPLLGLPGGFSPKPRGRPKHRDNCLFR